MTLDKKITAIILIIIFVFVFYLMYKNKKEFSIIEKKEIVTNKLYVNTKGYMNDEKIKMEMEGVLSIKNNGEILKIGVDTDSVSENFKTTAENFWFNKNLIVDGSISSYERDLELGVWTKRGHDTEYKMYPSIIIDKNKGDVSIGVPGDHSTLLINTGNDKVTIDIPNQPKGSIRLCNNTNNGFHPVIVSHGKNIGMELISVLDDDAEGAVDVYFSSRKFSDVKPAGDDFTDKSRVAYSFNRYTTSLMQIKRDGHVSIGENISPDIYNTLYVDKTFMVNTQSGENTVDLLNQPLGSIRFCNNSSDTYHPSIVSHGKDYGLEIISVRDNVPNEESGVGSDMYFSVRAPGSKLGEDFGDKTKIAYSFNRYTTPLFQIYRDGVLKLNNYGHEATIGSMKSGYFHFYSDTAHGFYFNKEVHVKGDVMGYVNDLNLGWYDGTNHNAITIQKNTGDVLLYNELLFKNKNAVIGCVDSSGNGFKPIVINKNKGNVKLITGLDETIDIGDQENGSINVCNNSAHQKALPSLMGKSTDGPGISLISAIPEIQSIDTDMFFDVRKINSGLGSDFDKDVSGILINKNRTAYKFSRFGKTLMSIKRDGRVLIGDIDTSGDDILNVGGIINCTHLRIGGNLFDPEGEHQYILPSYLNLDTLDFGKVIPGKVMVLDSSGEIGNLKFHEDVSGAGVYLKRNTGHASLKGFDEHYHCMVIDSDGSGGQLQLNYYVHDNIELCHGGGNVLIGKLTKDSSGYKFDVNGNVNFDGIINVHNNGHIANIGDMASGYFHFNSDTSHGFYFDKEVHVNGDIMGYHGDLNLGVYDTSGHNNKIIIIKKDTGGVLIMNDLDVYAVTQLKTLFATDTHINYLEVLDEAKINKLDVSGVADMHDVMINGILHVNGLTQLNILDVYGVAAVYGETHLNKLDVSGATIMHNNATVYGATKLNTLDVSGTTHLNTLDVTDINGTTILRGYATVYKNLDVYKKTTLHDTLDVTDISGTTLFRGHVHIGKDFDVSGVTRLQSLYTKDVHLDTLDVTDISGTALFRGHAHINKNLDVSGITNLNNLIVHGDITINSNLIYDNLVINNDLTVCKATKLNTLDVSGTTHLNTLDVNDVSGTTILRGHATVFKNLDVYKKTTLHDTLDVTDISGTTLFRGHVHINKNLDVSGTTNLKTLEVDTYTTLNCLQITNNYIGENMKNYRLIVNFDTTDGNFSSGYGPIIRRLNTFDGNFNSLNTKLENFMISIPKPTTDYHSNIMGPVYCNTDKKLIWKVRQENKLQPSTYSTFVLHEGNLMGITPGVIGYTEEDSMTIEKYKSFLDLDYDDLNEYGYAPIIISKKITDDNEILTFMRNIPYKEEHSNLHVNIMGPYLSYDNVYNTLSWRARYNSENGVIRYARFRLFSYSTSSFTGSHNFPPSEDSNLKQSESLKNHIGKIVEVTGKVAKKPYEINQIKPKIKLSSSRNSKKVVGVISTHSDEVIDSETNYDWEDDSHNMINNYIRINSIGEGLIRVCDETGPIEAGDLICSSSIKGYGMKQRGSTIKSSTVAKCLEDCDFTDDETFNEDKYEKTFPNYSKWRYVACVYYCG